MKNQRFNIIFGATIFFLSSFAVNTIAQTCFVNTQGIVHVLSADAIPAISNPGLISADWASNPVITEFNNINFGDNDLVIGVYIDGEARAYPHRIFWWHEIVNDVVGGKAISVTYCPLTGTGITYDRIINGSETTLGVSGNLFNNNLVMYDRATNSLIPQMCPKGITGSLQNYVLTYVPCVETTWGAWKKMRPNTSIISFDTGYGRNYDYYPYGNYITNNEYILYGLNPDDSRLPRKDMVHGVISGAKVKVYPFKQMNDRAVVNDVVGQLNVLVIYDKNSKMSVSFNRSTILRTLSFRIGNVPGSDGMPFDLIDEETGSAWNINGEAISGSLQGTQLEQVAEAYTGFWFAFGAFYPDVEIFDGSILAGADDDAGGKLPDEFNLAQNYPNPFNPETLIKYDLPKASFVSIKIYDLLGRFVKTLTDENKPAGFLSVSWNGTNDAEQPVSSGIYFFRIQAGDLSSIRKMILIR